jgi:hypothetical protein
MLQLCIRRFTIFSTHAAHHGDMQPADNQENRWPTSELATAIALPCLAFHRNQSLSIQGQPVVFD